jgi:2-polyprenyl-3-methyl-5-hydroxy-6-metoxy-1,4-benzoquinol methylase/glycosyltransferase involved in cell wall biosynthesis
VRTIVVEKCPACSGRSLLPAFKRGDGLPVANCCDCGCLVLLKYPENLFDAYDARYFVKTHESSADVGYSNYIDDVSPLNFLRHLAALEATRLATQKEKALLLDVGAASGDFLALAQLFGWQRTEGVEITSSARTLARRLGVVEPYATMEDIPSNRAFDFITAWELIEHLPDLTSFITTLRAHLKNDGVFLCSTPDAGQCHFYPRPEQWLGFHVSLEHLSYFTSTSLRKFLQRYFPFVEVWSSPSQTFYHQLFAVAFAEAPGPHVIEKIRAFQNDSSVACDLAVRQNEWSIPAALMDLHSSGEYPSCSLRRNYSKLQALLLHIESDEASLLSSLLASAIGDRSTANAAFDEFLKHTKRSVIPCTVVQRVLPAGRQNSAESRAERLAMFLKRSATYVRSSSQSIRHTIKSHLDRANCHFGRTQLAKILDMHRAVKGVVIYPPFVSYSLLRQRPHQLGRALAEQNYLFFFCTGDPPSDKVDGFRQLAENFYLCNVPPEVFRIVRDPIVYISRPAGWRQKVEEVAGTHTARIFYDWIDALPIFGRLEDQIDEHSELLEAANIVATSASLLFAEARKSRPDVLLLPNGVRIEDFENIAALPDIPPPALQSALDQNRPIVGYYGSISEWFDFDLMQRVLELNPDKTFVLVGAVWDVGKEGQTLWEQLNCAENLVYVNHVDYYELGRYLRWFDVAMIPFVLNTLTHATSPVKLFEYMAAAKPIITTGMIECKKYKSVLWGNSAAEFSECLNLALSLRGDIAYLTTLRKEAWNNTWTGRARTLDRAFMKMQNSGAILSRDAYATTA